MEVISPLEVEIKAHFPALFRQLVESTDPLHMVREQISNIFAKEVDAKNVEITHYWDPQHGPSFIFRDDGCGMNYTGDLENPGRLDRFIHFGYSGVAGFDVDEFSWKGLGSKLAYNCKRARALRALVVEKRELVRGRGIGGLFLREGLTMKQAIHPVHNKAASRQEA
jgi:hypothetical protein